MTRIKPPVSSAVCPQAGTIARMASREEILLEYLDKLQYPPYPVQEEALFAWAACDQGVLLSAPTGTGKTLVAEACRLRRAASPANRFITRPR